MDPLVNETNSDALNINSLPNEVILKIFGCLKQNELGKIARVCRRWNVLTRIPVLWKKVNVQIFPSHRSPTALTKSFINRLSSCVTSIRLHYSEKFIALDFVELCVILQEKCPHLEALHLVNCEFSVSFSSVIDLCTQFLPDVKKLAFSNCIFLDHVSTGEYDGISKIELLYAYACNLGYCDPYIDDHYPPLNKPPFSRMPYLKEIHASFTDIGGDSWFEGETSFFNQLQVLILGDTHITSRIFSAIKSHGLNIKELCLNLADLDYPDFDFNNPVFPHLETICLELYKGIGVNCESVVSLIQSCPSLKNIYVQHLAESVAEHPFIVANSCKLEIVKDMDCNHSDDVEIF